MRTPTVRPLFDRALVRVALVDALKKLDPRRMLRNPVMFVVEVGAAFTLALAVQAALGRGEAAPGFIVAISAWLWITLLFANFAEAMAEGRGKAQADSLRKARQDVFAHKLAEARRDAPTQKVSAAALRRGDLVLVEAGQAIPGDGEVIEGIASVDESAVTGESAPVIRESGGDRSSVTGGTQVLSDWIVVRISANPGETFLDRMIGMVEGAKRKKTPNEIALDILLAALSLVFLLATATLLPFSQFVSEATGVGKTFAMLEAARRAQAEGLDVVLGVVETHGRNETAALLAGLPLLPLRPLEHRGVGLQEFDLDAALKRRPGLLLIDELAHTNAPGSRHPKRWQDVFELLAAGIDVHTTLNVQHLESLNDIVAQITWVRVRETIPDAVFDRADEVELVDLPPDALLERLHEGRVYLPEQARKAAHAFFRKGNLLALRELALRRMAQRVDSDVQAYRREHGIATLWPAAERLLVCVGASPGAARLVRAAARIATSLRAEWIAVNVETPALALAGAAEREQLAASLRLAESLGAEVLVLVDEAVADALLRVARERNVSRIVVGKPARARLRDRLHRSLLRALVRGADGIDIHVITGDRAAPAAVVERPVSQHSPTAHYLWCAALVASLTAVGSLVFPYVDRSDIIMLYIVGIMLAAVRFGRGPSTAAALLSVAAFDFFYVPPFFTFAVSDVQYVLTFAVMLAVGLLISTLTSRIRMQIEVARVRERRTAALYSLSRELAQLRHKVSIATCAARHIGETLGARVAVLLPDERGQLVPVQGTDAALVADPRELSVARWAFEHGPAGRNTDTLPGAAATHLPLVAAGRTIGVLSVESGDRPRDTAAAQLLETLGSQTALALHRVLLAQEAQSAELRARAEELRSSLLSSVSHDLRTPLATITGAATTLLEGGPGLPREVHHDLADAIREEAERLARLVGNLLDMSRLESGELVLQREWTPIEEPIGAALDRLEGQLAGREVDVHVEPGLPLVALDALLMEQLLMNLLENTMKYTPPGTPITITATRDGEAIALELLDRGPGIPEDALPRIFDKFVRAGGPPGMQGVGLGLAICRAVAEAHGGSITAGKRPGGGAVFRVSLPIGGEAPSVPAEEPE